MSELSQKLREALNGIEGSGVFKERFDQETFRVDRALYRKDDEEMFCMVREIENVAEVLNLITSLLTEYEKLEREAEAGKYLFEMLERAHSEFPELGYWSRVKNAAVLAAYQRVATGVEPQPSAYRTACGEEK